MLSGFSIFAIIITLLLVSWSLVTFWQRFLENFFYNTLGLNPENTLVTLGIAIFATLFFLFIVWFIKVLNVIPNIDSLIFDYNEETNIGGNLDAARGSRVRFRARPRRITGRISPRGALFLQPQ